MRYLCTALSIHSVTIIINIVYTYTVKLWSTTPIFDGEREMVKINQYIMKNLDNGMVRLGKNTILITQLFRSLSSHIDIGWPVQTTPYLSTNSIIDRQPIFLKVNKLVGCLKKTTILYKGLVSAWVRTMASNNNHQWLKSH